MVSSKRLIELARKWKKIAVSGKKRNFIASRGHVFLYTVDDRRFMIPLSYLNNELFRELFRMAEEVFGLPTDGPIKVPCDTEFMENLLSIIRYSSSMHVERAEALTVSNGHCRASAVPVDLQNLQLVVM
ncbi:hypothetical protein HPP92_012958 [Vanilla planifolia]|uniref:Uncharacterized protein n=1 Tax=Vanilla planifolia TaxID=51239 RepID=A0A835QWN6_VANPL|nr:hypothetical protein HPP92_012958 [Vanilla planifolia]